MKSTFFVATVALAIVFGGILASEVHAQTTVLTDDFTYPDGDLVGNGPWTNHSGTGEFIQVVSNAVELIHGAGSREDAGATFATSYSSGLLSAAFDVVVNDDAPIISGDDEYFAHFMMDGDFTFPARLYVVEDAGNDYTFGLSTTSGGSEISYTTGFSFGTTNSVLLSFNLNTGLASLSVDGGATISSAVTALGENLDRFALRQSNSASDESIGIDNLVITHIPEPGSAALLSVGLIGLVLRRRRGC